MVRAWKAKTAATLVATLLLAGAADTPELAAETDARIAEILNP